jgi:hypothetical protein
LSNDNKYEFINDKIKFSKILTSKFASLHVHLKSRTELPRPLAAGFECGIVCYQLQKLVHDFSLPNNMQEHTTAMSLNPREQYYVAFVFLATHLRHPKMWHGTNPTMGSPKILFTRFTMSLTPFLKQAIQPVKIIF